jgi:hypothetical protein
LDRQEEEIRIVYPDGKPVFHYRFEKLFHLRAIDEYASVTGYGEMQILGRVRKV